MEMPQKAHQPVKPENEVPDHRDIVLKPAVSAADLQADTEYDPDGAEEFVALIRAMRKESSRNLNL